MSTVYKRFDQLVAVTTPLTGAEVLACIQGADSKKMTLDQLETKVLDGMASLAGVETLTNKTIDSVLNLVGADHVHFKVKATQNLAKGDIVKFVGYNTGEDAIEVAKVSSASDVAIGIVYATINNGEFGPIIHSGVINDVDTDGLGEGTILYPNTSGGLTATKPSSGTYQACAYVLRDNASNGVLLVEFSEPAQTAASTNTANTNVLRSTNGDVFVGAVHSTPVGTQTPVTNGTLVFELTNNTTITVKAKGSDGVVRSTTLTLVP